MDRVRKPATHYRRTAIERRQGDLSSEEATPFAETNQAIFSIVSKNLDEADTLLCGVDSHDVSELLLLQQERVSSTNSLLSLPVLGLHDKEVFFKAHYH